MIVGCILVLVSAVLVLCESGYVDTLQPCDVRDGACNKALVQKILLDIGKTGISDPPLSIPPVDPLALDTLVVPVVGLLNITFRDGVVKGVKDCVVDGFESGIEKGHAVLDVTCDITIKGKYRLGGSTPAGDNPFAGAVLRGDGNCKVKLENLHLKLDMFYDVIRKQDGEVYFRCRPSEARYEFRVGAGKVTFDRLLLGEQDATVLGVTYVNQNLKLLLNTFGRFFFDPAKDIILKMLHIWFDAVPAKRFVSNDLTPYLKS